ncbi:hypothetical protein VNO77_37028 [Canavalia gladiata]|uniref:Uncharacterized protein n=1 Tax=Canavalia gladiata TaxID=3824 RepID=A0AAN9PUL4_CANGL
MTVSFVGYLTQIADTLKFSCIIVHVSLVGFSLGLFLVALVCYSLFPSSTTPYVLVKLHAFCLSSRHP